MILDGLDSCGFLIRAQSGKVPKPTRLVRGRRKQRRRRGGKHRHALHKVLMPLKSELTLPGLKNESMSYRGSYRCIPYLDSLIPRRGDESKPGCLAGNLEELHTRDWPFVPLVEHGSLARLSSVKAKVLHLTAKFIFRACQPDSAVHASWSSTRRSSTLLDTLMGSPTFSAALSFRSRLSALLSSEVVWNK